MHKTESKRPYMLIGDSKSDCVFIIETAIVYACKATKAESKR